MERTEDRRVAHIQRRFEDRHVCALHDVLQDETKDHRVVVCGKIAEAKKVADSALPRWVFISTMSTILIISVTILGIFWRSMSEGQADLKRIVQDGNAVLHRRITETSNDTDIIKDMVRDVQKQQAVLDNKLYNVEQRLERK